MKLIEIIKVLDAQILNGDINDNLEIYDGCGADLMSDFMSFGKEHDLLLTGLLNPQVIRTAEMMDVKLVVFVRGKTPTEDIIKLAKEMGITVLSTKKPMFYACGSLYSAGLRGRGI